SRDLPALAVGEKLELHLESLRLIRDQAFRFARIPGGAAVEREADRLQQGGLAGARVSHDRHEPGAGEVDLLLDEIGAEPFQFEPQRSHDAAPSRESTSWMSGSRSARWIVCSFVSAPSRLSNSAATVSAPAPCVPFSSRYSRKSDSRPVSSPSASSAASAVSRRSAACSITSSKTDRGRSSRTRSERSGTRSAVWMVSEQSPSRPGAAFARSSSVPANLRSGRPPE